MFKDFDVGIWASKVSGRECYAVRKGHILGEDGIWACGAGTHETFMNQGFWRP